MECGPFLLFDMVAWLVCGTRQHAVWTDRLSVCMRIQDSGNVWFALCVCACMHVRVHVRVRVCVYVYVCVHVCMVGVHVYLPSAFKCIYVYIFV